MGALIAQLRGLGPLRLAALVGVGLGVLGLVAMLALRASEPPMALLYGDLDPRDAGQMVASLERARIPHRLSAGGAQIVVPESDVPRIRLMMAREGLPSGGSVGYEIFDRGESLTTTPFQQDVNRLRALEGEIARSIRGLTGVRTARVHLVLPRREPFSRERGEAQASVVLTMQGAQRLDREGVQAVLHLVAAAVPGLRPQQISIVDSRGELLARGGQALTGPAAAQTAEELRRTTELRLARAVEDLLERTLGPGRVRAEASVEMDFDRVQTTEERFDPENQVPRSTQSSTESNRSGEAGNVSVANQLPGAETQSGGSRNEQQRSEETTNFEIGRLTRNTLREQPAVKRLSLAVLVDGVWEPQPDGAPPRFRERNADELGRIMSLARSAVGFNEERGDKVEVVSLRFAEPSQGETAPEGFSILGQTLPPALMGRLIESGILALVALAAILLIGKPVANRLVLAMAPQPVLVGIGPDGNTVTFTSAAEAALAQANGTITGPAQVGGPGATPLLPQGEAAATEEEDPMVKVARIEGQMRASALAALAEMVDNNPDAAVTVIRRWLAPEEGL
ncbi:flagellar basal-body MS-ring/collar protein FliF [Falsiroseomonas tokyonensis]|uniref:Flagellar M-ring protein n=1 Tax=Falsiroseomonas tokyonensis TaxID=430521 RepID=A0ABV7BU33_9PROT|nr:flagellar basal-body MS-ring/collar protein FliF [Falsiroseomonas tokyonensis]MBU8538521.1 flagellar M-ring protein FliF [Falsiroseomonas tokyonensis]